MEACDARPGTWADDPSGYEPTPDDHTAPPRRRCRDDDAVAHLAPARTEDRSLKAKADGRHRPGNATSRRRNVSGSKRISARTETNHPGERIGAERRATVAAMPGSPAPSLGDGQRARRRALPAPGQTGAGPARGQRRARAAACDGRDLRAGTGMAGRRQRGAVPPADRRCDRAAAAAAPGGWVATTCGTQRTLTPTRREAKSAFRASLAARKRAQRRDPVLRGRRCSSPPTPPASIQPSTC